MRIYSDLAGPLNLNRHRQVAPTARDHLRAAPQARKDAARRGRDGLDGDGRVQHRRDDGALVGRRHPRARGRRPADQVHQDVQACAEEVEGHEGAYSG